MPRINAFMAEPSTIRARAAEALSVLARQPQCDPARLAATDIDGGHPIFLPDVPAYEAPGVRVFEVVR